MALHDTWGDFNKRIDTERDITYSATPHVFDGEGELEPKVLYWTCTRRSAMSFVYFGLTHDAALACRDAMNAEYTRPYMRWQVSEREIDGDYPEVSVTPSRVIERTTQVTPQLVAGDNWEVSVSVDETDEIVSTVEPKTVDDFESLFQEAAAREAIESGASNVLAVISAKWNSITNLIEAEFTQSISGFDPNTLSAEVYDSQYGTWTTATDIIATATTITFAATKNVKFRLVYGQIQSKPWTTNDRKQYRVTVVGVSASVSQSWIRNYPVVGAGSLTLDILFATDFPLGSNADADDSFIGFAAFDGLYVNFALTGKYIYVEDHPTLGKVYRVKGVPFDVFSPLPKTISVSLVPRGTRFVDAGPFTFTQENYINVVQARQEPYDLANHRVRVVYTFESDLSADDVRGGLSVKYLVRDPRTGILSEEGDATIETFQNPSTGLFSVSFFVPMPETAIEKQLFIRSEIVPQGILTPITSFYSELTVKALFVRIESVTLDSGTDYAITWDSNLYAKTSQNGIVKYRAGGVSTDLTATFVRHVSDRVDVWRVIQAAQQAGIERFNLTIDGVKSEDFMM